jgi:hypothetical protein
LQRPASGWVGRARGRLQHCDFTISWFVIKNDGHFP